VYAILEDKNNTMWFGTQNGIFKYNRNTFKHIPIPFKDTTGVFLDKAYPIMSPNAVHSLAQDNNGDIWIGTGAGGAYRYDGKNFTSHLSEIGKKQEDGLYHNWIPNITKDAKGNIWFASMTHGGVSKFDGNTFTQFMPKDGLSDDMIRTIYKDRSGKLWFGFNGSRNSGLTFYDGKTFNTLSKKDGLCNTSITAIYEDPKGNIWLGSGRENLCIYDGKNFTEFSSKEGEPFSVILFIIGDKEGNIWFGGTKGLWKYDGETVMDMSKN